MVTSVGKTNQAAARLVEITRDSYRTVTDHVVGLQERNVQFAQGVVDGSIKELRHQAESNQAFAQELAERAEEQRDAHRALVEQSFDAYLDLAYAPFSYYKEGLAAAKRASL